MLQWDGAKELDRELYQARKFGKIQRKNYVFFYATKIFANKCEQSIY